MKKLSLILFLLTPLFSWAGEQVSTGFWSDLAIDSSDTVAYWTTHAQNPNSQVQLPRVEGKEAFLHEWKGAEWRFASAAARDKFAANPEKYAPHYNGFCANALSLGEGLVATDGQTWDFFGDELYLFYAPSGRERWLAGDFQEYKRAADAAWADLKDKG